MPTKPSNQKTLLVKDNEGEFKVTLPEGAHVTFGPDVPFERKRNVNFPTEVIPRAYSLRVYTDSAKKDLIAVFSQVQWFRDISMPVAKLVIRETGSSLWKSDEHGYETQTSGKVEKSFVEVSKLLK